MSNPKDKQNSLPISLQELQRIAPSDVIHFDKDEFQTALMKRFEESTKEYMQASKKQRYFKTFKALYNVPINLKRLNNSYQFRSKVADLVNDLQERFNSTTFLEEYKEDRNIYSLTITCSKEKPKQERKILKICI